MKPVLFEIFGIKIYGYGTMIAIGIFAGLFLLDHRAKNKNYSEDSIWNMAIIAIILGVLGGKLLYIITEINAIIEDPSMLLDVGEGFVIYGSIIGGVLGVIFYCKRKGWNVLKIFDLVIPSLPLAQGFGRIGCFLAGCCYGRETTLPIGIEFKNSPFAPAGVLRHPTQIYSSIFDFILAFFLLWLDKKERKDGQLFGLYFICYSIGRFMVEFLRDDPRGSVSVFSTSQFIGLFTLVLGMIMFNLNRIKPKKKQACE
jgi:phosphatidylglycerol:prolipoprotein diacylglycerol transferase